MRILVTGGAGFIGSNIVDAYVSAGHEVHILDNFSTGREINVNADAVLHRADIRDREAVDALFKANAFDLVNHHAAQLDVRVSVRDPQFDAAQNVIGSLNLLQSAVESGTRRFVFASTGGAVYGEQESFPADEEHPTNPISPYGVTKLAVEKYLHCFRHIHGIDYVVCRYTNVYGPRQNPHGESGVIAIFCDMMHRGEQPTINGDGTQTRDYVFVGDVVAAHMSVLDHLQRKGDGTFNICTNTETSVNELFGTLNNVFGNVFEHRYGPPMPGEQLRSVCSYGRAQNVLGWSPKVDLKSGLERTVEHHRNESR
ncbi:MAG: NAD-dependent epimerase/dehydratase family protein [bacterium]|nr:NAD-dependent epimerase/dehydratase family protein [Candidatus Kapabacteria bacterium]